MSRIDLDAIERHWATVGNSACPECQNEALVAELRAARKVVDAAAAYRGRLSGGGAVEKWASLAAALAAYAEATR